MMIYYRTQYKILKMVKQIRSHVHHLGDQVIWINSEIARGREYFNVELTHGLLDLFPRIDHKPEVTRYHSRFEFDYGVKFTKFDPNKFTKVELPKGPYITTQFDTSKTGMDPNTPEVRAYVLDEDWKNYIIRYYTKMGFNLIDIGSNKYTLAETAYIMQHSKGHVGASSAFGVFSRCVGVPFTHIYYNCPIRELCQILPEYMETYGKLFSLNGITHYFRDPNFELNN